MRKRPSAIKRGFSTARGACQLPRRAPHPPPNASGAGVPGEEISGVFSGPLNSGGLAGQ